jgi:hypothetical protein
LSKVFRMFPNILWISVVSVMLPFSSLILLIWLLFLLANLSKSLSYVSLQRFKHLFDHWYYSFNFLLLIFVLTSISFYLLILSLRWFF